ncbi:hypothetical protein Clacol_000363 [Clathrus columnatus]|uniref:Uncharacterized protein n=1 Tax=Clathrus columnatus TaxID=1419009 RepID=A0AAV5A0G1_9AGAM|nr:hypothetical protein Clacol_000363 [Clathrus columnatus]
MSVPRPMARKRRPTRPILEQNLQLLKAVLALPMLSATLPASPPPSRSASPAPSLSSGRRKLPPQEADSLGQQVTTKRARTSLQHTDVHQSIPDVRSPRISPQSVRKEEVPVISLSSSVTTPSQPQILAVAPTPGAPETSSYSHRRGKPTTQEYSRFHDRYLGCGKLLKQSAQDRMRIPPESGRNRPNSSQLAHLGFIARIEAIDGLLNFAYSIWCKDMSEGRCHQSLWETLDAYTAWVRNRWEVSDARGDAQRAFVGLIRIIEAYVYARKASALNSSLSKSAGDIENANKQPEPNQISSLSPATSLGGSSQHSASNNSPALMNAAPPAIVTSRATPHGPAVSNSSSSSSGQPLNVPKSYFDAVQSAINYSQRSARNVSVAGVYLNLPILSRCYPKTYARILTCQLRIEEEYEADFDQDECSRPDSDPDHTPGPGEGPLMWPIALSTPQVDGLVWMLLLGRSMIREIAYPAGYRGMEGLQRKDAAR